MRKILMFAVLAAISTLAAEAAGPQPPVNPWPVDRFGRTMVPYVDGATIVPPTGPGNSVGVIAGGHAMTSGWSSFVVTFQGGVGGSIPMNGLVEARLVGIAPTGMVDQSITRFSSQPSGWGHPDPRLKGFHICAQAGCITLMLDGTVTGGDGRGQAVMGRAPAKAKP